MSKKRRKKIILAIIAILLAGGVAYYSTGGRKIMSGNRGFLCIEGDVEIKKANKDEWKPVTGKAIPQDGDSVKSSSGAACEILLSKNDGNVVRVNQNTELTIGDAKNIELKNGSIFCAIENLPRGSTFKVQTPVAACGARGTGWEVSTFADESEVKAFEGDVFVKGARGEEVSVTSGRKVIVIKDTEPGKITGIAKEELDEWDSWKKELKGCFKCAGVRHPIALSDRRDEHPVWQKGVGYMSWDMTRYETPGSDEALKELKDLGVEWVAISTTWYLDSAKDLYIRPQANSPNKKSLGHVIDAAHRLGLRVMLKPHIDIVEKTGPEWRGQIGYDTEENWQIWLKQYKSFLLYHAGLAEEHDVELLCVGTELVKTTHREKEWRDLIAGARKVFSGPMTYAAHWEYEYKDIKFWDALDYAGVDAFFPLSEKKNPTLEEIKSGWPKWVGELEEWQARIQKPVIFTEVGYRSADWAAAYPWVYWREAEVDLQQQVDCTQALMETFWDKEWFYGTYWWHWEANILAGGPHDKNYTPQDKPAKDILIDWYSKEPHTYGRRVLKTAE